MSVNNYFYSINPKRNMIYPDMKRTLIGVILNLPIVYSTSITSYSTLLFNLNFLSLHLHIACGEHDRLQPKPLLQRMRVVLYPYAVVNIRFYPCDPSWEEVGNHYVYRSLECDPPTPPHPMIRGTNSFLHLL